MLLRLIDAVRAKPKAQRQRYAFLGAAVITVIIAGGWSLTVPERIATITNSVTVDKPEAQVATVPFAGLWQQFLGATRRTTSIPVTESVVLSEENLASDSVIAEDESLLLPSGSTIRFGEDEYQASTSTISIIATSSGAGAVE